MHTRVALCPRFLRSRGAPRLRLSAGHTVHPGRPRVSAAAEAAFRQLRGAPRLRPRAATGQSRRRASRPRLRALLAAARGRVARAPEERQTLGRARGAEAKGGAQGRVAPLWTAGQARDPVPACSIFSNRFGGLFVGPRGEGVITTPGGNEAARPLFHRKPPPGAHAGRAPEVQTASFQLLGLKRRGNRGTKSAGPARHSRRCTGVLEGLRPPWRPGPGQPAGGRVRCQREPRQLGRPETPCQGSVR